MFRNSMKFAVVAGALVAISLLTVGVMTSSGQTTALTNESHQSVNEEINAQKPNEIQIRTGIPELRSFENAYSDAINYSTVKEGQYSYLDRAIKKGSTLISNIEMDEYFKTFSANGYRFAITSNEGATKYYTINYFEQPISLEKHNVLISIKDNLDSSRKDLSKAEMTKLSKAIDKPFRWIEVDNNAAMALLARAAVDGNEFNVTTNEGYKTVRVMYIGPLSEELKLPEFQSMYGLPAADEGGQ